MSKKELLLNYKMKAKPIMMKSLAVYAFDDESKYRKEFENKFRNYIYFDGSGITRDKKGKESYHYIYMNADDLMSSEGTFVEISVVFENTSATVITEYKHLGRDIILEKVYDLTKNKSKFYNELHRLFQMTEKAFDFEEFKKLINRLGFKK